VATAPTSSFRWLADQGLSYSAGFGLIQDVVDKINQIPDQGWTPAYDSDCRVRDGGWATELTGMLELTTWPAGMRVIVRAERPHPGGQLWVTDVDGHSPHRVRCQHHPRAAGGPRARALAPGPLQGPDQKCQGRRAAQLALDSVHAQPDLGGRRSVGEGADRVAVDARIDRHRSQALGTETDSTATVLGAGSVARRSRRVWRHLSDRAPHSHPSTIGHAELKALPAST